MPNTYLLIDFENVQPKSLATLRGRPVHLRVFVGSQQSKVPFDLAQTVQSLGAQAEYVQIAGTGRNALDLFQAVLLVQPEHAEAQVSLARTIDLLLQRAQQELDAGSRLRPAS